MVRAEVIVRSCPADDMSMPPDPSVRVLLPIETAPEGLVRLNPRILVSPERVVARFEVAAGPNNTASAEVGATELQLPLVPQLVSVAPVQSVDACAVYEPSGESPTTASPRLNAMCAGRKEGRRVRAFVFMKAVLFWGSF